MPTISYASSKLVVSGGYLSTGVARINHYLGTTKYDVITQKLHHADSIIVTGKYANYFTVEVRRNDVLTSSDFSFSMMGDNY